MNGNSPVRVGLRGCAPRAAVKAVDVADAGHLLQRFRWAKLRPKA